MVGNRVGSAPSSGARAIFCRTGKGGTCSLGMLCYANLATLYAGPACNGSGCKLPCSASNAFLLSPEQGKLPCSGDNRKPYQPSGVSAYFWPVEARNAGESPVFSHEQGKGGRTGAGRGRQAMRQEGRVALCFDRPRPRADCPRASRCARAARVRRSRDRPEPRRSHAPSRAPSRGSPASRRPDRRR